MREKMISGRRLLPLILVGNALLRIAGAAGGVLVGLYLAALKGQGREIDAALVGTLGAVTFIAELVGALPMGVLSDVFAPRLLMITGSLLGAIATQLFGMSGALSIFFLSRALEGLAVAASSPAILAHLTDVTEGDYVLRGKVMSYFELSLLGGLALGALVAGGLWSTLGTGAFAALAAVYVACAVLLGLGATGSKKHGASQALAGFKNALRDPFLARLAPAWLCINVIVGLWLGPTLTFLLTLEDNRGQFLTGAFAGNPLGIGFVQLGYAIIFAAGVTIWSFFLYRFERTRVLKIALVAMFFACAGFYLINHSQTWSSTARWSVMGLTAMAIMVESGFTPAALALLADVVGAQGGRGAAMGIYSVLLSLGALIGSLLAGQVGKLWAVDGLIYATVAMAVAAFATVYFLPRQRPALEIRSRG
jgi:MFS family permease